MSSGSLIGIMPTIHRNRPDATFGLDNRSRLRYTTGIKVSAVKGDTDVRIHDYLRKMSHRVKEVADASLMRYSLTRTHFQEG